MSSVDSIRSSVGFLAHGGEMGRRIEELDWERHPLGPPEGWPQSLKIAIRIMLSSRFAMWMGWGSEFFFFYNDAYAPTLGLKHGRALGAPAPEVWAEIWNDIGPRAESVIRTGQATWDESLLLFLERSGFAEETYHTFSYSAIPDDDGSTGGMLCVVSEETDRVIGERRLALLREVGADLASTKTEEEIFRAVAARLAEHSEDLPFALIYLFTPDGKSAHLACAHHSTAGSAIAPERIEMDGVNETWPATRLFLSGEAVTAPHLASRFAELPTAPWDKPPRDALLVPISQQGQQRPAGFLVAGLNPYRPVGDAYRGFLDLLSGQIAAGLASARAYEAERKRAEALAEIDRAKTAFFSNVSHEFRTPLTLLLGPLEEIISKPDDELPPEDRSLAEVAHRNGLRLLKLVNSLLEFSRIEAGRVSAHFEPTDLAAYTAELASSFRSAMERAGLNFVVDCPPLPSPVQIDRDMWEKIVLNLLSNAFKFTLQGEIRISVQALDGAVEMAVHDTGVGIPEEAQPRLFERFFRVAGANGRTHEGSGIGLALVHELVKLHGGAIRVKSEFGFGSTFIVTLPCGGSHWPVKPGAVHRAPGAAGQAAQPFVAEALRWLPEQAGAQATLLIESVEDSMPLAPHSARPRILIADDNADMRDYVARLLSRRFDVIAVNDGQAALESALDERPDLVLSDVMMPLLDGFGLLRAMRADPALESVPVILLSARAGEEARVDGLDAGADDYLTKPFHARELLAKVGSTLTLAKVRAQGLAREAELQAERAESQDQLRKSEQRLRAIYDGTHVYLGLLTPDGTVLEANRASLAFGPSQRDEVVGRPFWEAVWFQYTPGAPEALRRAVHRAAAGQLVRFEAPIFAPSGDLLTFDISLEPIRNERTEVVLIVPELRNVTERKRAEEALRAGAEQMRLMADTAPILIAHCDRDHRYKFVNEPYASRFGLRRDQVIGRRIPEVIGQAGYERIRDHVERTLAGEAVEFEITIPYDLLGPLYMRCAYAPERNPDGEVIGLVGAIVDITDRKRAELQLTEQARLLDLSFDAIFVRDPGNRITYWNKGAEDAYGFTREEALGRNPYDLLQTEFPEPLELIYEQLHRDGRWVGELRHTRKDGSILFDNTRWALDRDAHRQPASILETNTDITHRKHTEMLLLEQTKLLEGIAKGWPLEDCLTALCAAVSKLSTHARACVLLTDPTRRFFPRSIAPDFSTAFVEALRDAPISEQAIGTCAAAVFLGQTVTCTDVASDSRWAPAWRELCLSHGVRACRSAPVRDADGLPLASVALCLDEAREPTEWENQLVEFGVHVASIALDRDRAGQALRQAKEAAEVANQSKDRFLAVLSHELRTPLTPVLMSLASWERDPAVRNDLREDLGMMKRNIELETKLIDDLLDLNRISSGKLPLRLESVSLNDAVKQVCGICDSSAREKEVRLEYSLDPAAGAVAADPARLQQVLWNLIKNAIKFTPEHGCIVVRTEAQSGHRSLVRVQDNGIGIPKEILSRIFNPFEQGDPGITRQFGGLGLGLAISKALVELHHGVIRAESDGPGCGAAFTIELPLEQTGWRVATAPPKEMAEAPQQLRLLVVEDHHDTARTLRALLTKAGYCVSLAGDVAGALDLARRETFDLLITDLGLPDGSGYDVMAGVQSIQPLPGIAMSGYGMDEDVRRSREAGFKEHVVKPIDLSQLKAAIRELMKSPA